MNDSLGVPLELQSHLVTFIDEGQIILQGEPPRHVVEDLLSAQELPEKILIYSEEGEGRWLQSLGVRRSSAVIWSQ